MMTFCRSLAFGASPVAVPVTTPHWSNQTLSGDYGFNAQGVLLGVPNLPPQAPFRSVGTAHFDGKGNLTWLKHSVFNGVPQNGDWIAASGTYTVNANCTGTMVVSTPNSRYPLSFALVIVRQGNEFHTVLDAFGILASYVKINAPQE